MASPIAQLKEKEKAVIQHLVFRLGYRLLQWPNGQQPRWRAGIQKEKKIGNKNELLLLYLPVGYLAAAAAAAAVVKVITSTSFFFQL